MSSATNWEEAKTTQIAIENCWVKLLSKQITMESTTKNEDDANSDITDDLDRIKGKVSYGFTFHVEQPETIVYGAETKMM